MSEKALPAGACDCHTHVFGAPGGPYRYAADRSYTPGEATVAQLVAWHDRLDITRVVLVQPSPYGTDNSCMAAALASLGARARGVAVIDDATPDAELSALHAVGVRGVRLNLHTAGRADPGEALAALDQAARRVAPLGWHVQTYTDLGVIAALHDALMTLPVPLVVDHFGRALGAGGVTQPGFEALLSLVRAGRAYVKLSAAHRLSRAPDFADMAPIVRALIVAGPERVVWASDWPHSGVTPGLAPEAVHPFNPVDDGAALARLRGWAGDEATLHRILVENPARL